MSTDDRVTTEDEERPVAISAEQVNELVEPVVTARGFDLEDVVVRSAAGRDEVRIVVDRDGGSGLDVLADLSNAVSDVLDAAPGTADQAYDLEVTSPGIDRPLTAPRHWRRALGRKVAVEVRPAAAEPAASGTKNEKITGRVGPVDDGRVRVVSNDRGRIRSRDIALDDVVKAVVQVDFGTPSTAELEACGLDPDAIRARQSDT